MLQDSAYRYLYIFIYAFVTLNVYTRQAVEYCLENMKLLWKRSRNLQTLSIIYYLLIYEYYVAEDCNDKRVLKFWLQIRLTEIRFTRNLDDELKGQ